MRSAEGERGRGEEADETEGRRRKGDERGVRHERRGGGRCGIFFLAEGEGGQGEEAATLAGSGSRVFAGKEGS